MSAPLLIAMPGNEQLSSELANALRYELGYLDPREFPDGETYLRFASSPETRSVVIVCTLAYPNAKFLPLVFAARTAREFGALKVGLLCPYLAYMRQDRRFTAGEAVTSRQIAHLISEAFDWMVTVDPHLHRYGALAEIYSIPTRVVHAAPLISQWIKTNIAGPLIIGPDSESEQWVAAVANDAGAPFCGLE
jgi:ribose-phosphate pyrophosphokinase